MRGSGLEALTLDPRALTGAALYLTVLGIVFAESGVLAGFFLPGDTVLFGAGLVSHRSSAGVDPLLLGAGVVVCAVAGDAVSYALGRRLGRPAAERRWPQRVRAADRLADRYGWWAVVIARFIPWVRTFTPLLAGAGSMRYRRFFAANLAGALIWGAGLIALGWEAARVPWIGTAALAVAASFVAGSAVLGAVLGVVRRRRRRPLA